MQHRSLKTEARELERLVKLAQSGDHDAFAKIYDILIQPIYRYIHYRANGDSVEDLLEIIFVKVWSNLGKYKKQSTSFSSWVFRIAHNVLVDYYRAKDTVDPIPEAHEDPRKESKSTYLAELSFNQDTLKKGLKNIKESYRQVLILKFINDLTNEEISEILGKSENSVRILQFRALKSLKEELEKMGVSDY